MNDPAHCDYAGKVKYATKSDAVRVLAPLSKRHRGHMRAYHCPECNCFHIGHQVNKRKRSLHDRKRERKRRKWGK